MAKQKLKMKKGIQLGVPNDVYHSDRTMISKSWLDRVNKSPFHLRQYLDEPYEKTEALIMGSAVDCLIFEPDEFDKQFVAGPDASKSTKVGKEIWAEFMENEVNGRDVLFTHLSVNWVDRAHQMADAIRSNPRMAEILSIPGGVAQPVVTFVEPMTGLKCKIKMDYGVPNQGVWIDLKTSEDASPYKFSKSVHDFRYNVQDAFYSHGIVAAGLKRDDFVFAVMEKTKGELLPDERLMAFYRLEDEDREAGLDAAMSDLAAIDFALTNDVWEGYPTRIQTIGRPGWARNRDV